MSFLDCYTTEEPGTETSQDNRWRRDIQSDMKIGIDHLFALKTELNKLHPYAQDALMVLLSR